MLCNRLVEQIEDIFGFLQMFQFDKILNFNSSQINKYAEDIKETHIDQIRSGIDANGQPFKAYTPQYAKRKALGKTGKKNQISFGITPPNLTLSGDMLLEKFQVASSKILSNIQIKYGIRKSKNGTKLSVNNELRLVADNQKLGPMVEEEVAVGLAKMVAANISKIHGRAVVLHI